jgi:hypothetical protein
VTKDSSRQASAACSSHSDPTSSHPPHSAPHLYEYSCTAACPNLSRRCELTAAGAPHPPGPPRYSYPAIEGRAPPPRRAPSAWAESSKAPRAPPAASCPSRALPPLGSACFRQSPPLSRERGEHALSAVQVTCWTGRSAVFLGFFFVGFFFASSSWAALRRRLRLALPASGRAPLSPERGEQGFRV